MEGVWLKNSAQFLSILQISIDIPVFLFITRPGFLLLYERLQVSQQFTFEMKLSVEIDLKEFGRKHVANVSCMFVIPLETFRNSRRLYSGNTLTLARGYHPK